MEFQIKLPQIKLPTFKKTYPLNEVVHINDLKELLYRSAETYKNNNAFLVKDGGVYRGITYERLLRDVKSCAAMLNSMGYMGKKIAVIGDNSYEWSVVYLAVVNCVGVIVPLDKNLPADEIYNSIVASGTEVIFHTDKVKSAIDSIKEKLPALKKTINMSDNFSGFLSDGNDLTNKGNTIYDDTLINPYEMRVLLFTSGTSADSKAVMLCHKNITSNIMSMCSMIWFDSSDVFLSVLPVHHTYEATCGFLTPLYQGATIAICEGLKQIVSNMKESGATIMIGVPLLYESMYKKFWQQASKTGADKAMKMGLRISGVLSKAGVDIKKRIFAQVHSIFGGKMRLMITGAAPINPVVSKWFRDIGVSFLQGYGLTECAPLVAVNRDVNFRDSSAGIPLTICEIRLDNVDANGIGEIKVKGENIMLGYYNNPAATEAVIKDGWLYTGDLGRFDDDGFLYISGRKKNVIVTKNGKNIYPEELETLLLKNRFIADAMVYGVKGKNDDLTVTVQIYPNFESLNEANIDRTQMMGLFTSAVKEINEKLPTYKRISKTIVRETEFIKTSTAKIKRHLNK
ncbi:MAG: AMP-binding protein [Oscillospiraceae bacterium]|nr:AMP-binding protein [Oscillospiraceae bacterium]